MSVHFDLVTGRLFQGFEWGQTFYFKIGQNFNCQLSVFQHLFHSAEKQAGNPSVLWLTEQWRRFFFLFFGLIAEIRDMKFWLVKNFTDNWHSITPIHWPSILGYMLSHPISHRWLTLPSLLWRHPYCSSGNADYLSLGIKDCMMSGKAVCIGR